MKNMKQKSVSSHSFAMIPRADIPRSSFRFQKTLKTAFSASYLIPIFCEDVLPGDTFNITATIVARTATPIVPIMDNWHLETFFFFVPTRLLWTNWQKFMGEQRNPGDSISFTIPQVVSPVGGFAVASLYDYFGLPCAGQIAAGNTISINCLPFRAYTLIWDQWFRDENLQTSVTSIPFGDGPDNNSWFYLLRRCKAPDYFTKALPFVQKGTAVSIPLGTQAIVKTGSENFTGAQISLKMLTTAGATPTATRALMSDGTTGSSVVQATAAGGLVSGATGLYPSNLYADLTTATAATINQLRQSFQIQKLLERDARGGTRYTELIRAHFGVVSPDARLQRPEYVGGGHTPVITSAIPQTSATGLTGSTTPVGTLAAVGTAQGRNAFTYAATEHGYIIGLINCRADLTYQQGIHRMWSRLTRYDFYFPVFAMLGEQPVYNRELYADGSANDALAFGYQERWAEYRYTPSMITGLYRSTSAGTIDYWHSSQKFTALPTLGPSFVSDQTDSVIQRNFAGGAATANQQILADILFDGTVARPLPMYSVPGLVDHF